MAKRRIMIFVKAIVFTLLAVSSVHAVNELLKPKNYYTETWPTTNTYQDFYQLKRDTVDVLFLGSSHAISALNPQVVYDNYGITSYNLGSEQQSLVITYYWLREALKYQSPQVVVLDTYMLHKYRDAYVYNDMNCSEGAVRKAMDSMRISPLKWEAARVIEKTDPTQSALSFLLLNSRYHTRWTLLGEDDYTETPMIEHGGIKGYTVLGEQDPENADTTFFASDADTVESEEFVETAKVYIDKIVELCNSENIKLILVNIPCKETIERYKATREYAEGRNIPYLDFNEESLYKKIGYDASENLTSHLNYLGAEKVSNYLGKLLCDEYGVQSREDSSYNVSRGWYEHMIQNINLQAITDAYQYLDQINCDEYSVFVFGPKSYSTFIDDELMRKFMALGFTTELRGLQGGTHYCAVKDSAGITEKLTADDVSFSGSIRGGTTVYRFVIDTKVMVDSRQKYSMVIDNNECGNMKSGLNIVVYDNEMKKIIDKVNIDTTVEELPVSRY